MERGGGVTGGERGEEGRGLSPDGSARKQKRSLSFSSLAGRWEEVVAVDGAWQRITVIEAAGGDLELGVLPLL